MYPGGCHLPEPTEVPLARWVPATCSQGDKKWSGECRYQMNGIAKRGLQEGEGAQVGVPGLSS